MKRYKMLVFSKPFDGQDAEFDGWYDGRHLADICALEGFTTAQRFRLQSVPMGNGLNRYLAIYDLETDDPDGDIAAMFAARDTAAMPISPAFNLDATTVMVYEETGPLVTRSWPLSSPRPGDRARTCRARRSRRRRTRCDRAG